MPSFAYVAKTRDGRTQKGTQTADSRQALVRSLQSKGWMPDRIQETGRNGADASGINIRGPKVKTTEILIFTRQLSTIVNSAFPCSRASIFCRSRWKNLGSRKSFRR